MTHRGPNDRGTYQADGVAFGVRRLSIVDVEGGHQPFAERDGRRLGDAERRALQPRGDPRASSSPTVTSSARRCDTEILPHLYERDGDALAEQLRGKFAHRRLGRPRAGAR